LRGFGLAFVGLLLTAAFLVGNILAAQSTANGANSTIDHYLQVNTTGTSGQYAEGPANTYPDVSTNGTWELWLYPTSYDRAGYGKNYLSKENAFTFGVNGGTYQWAVHDGNEWKGWFDTYIPAQLNAWTHLAWVKSDTSMKLYLNGQLAYEANNAPSSLAQNSNPLRLGDRRNGEFFEGRIDEVRVWGVARTPDQISQNVHKRLIGNESDLRGYWDFNEDAGTGTVYDRSLVGQNLTLAGSPTRLDAKQVTSAPGGDTIISFPRTYLPGVGGWTVPENATDFRALVVAGGGGGGGDEGGGGGAGGLTESSLVPGASSTLSVVVGMGGFGAKNDELAASNGQDSQFGTLSTLGGGAGGDASNDGVPTRNGANGGSGGGRAGEQSGGTAGTGAPGQGNNGAASSNTIGNGGGGAGAAASGINGGHGKVVTIIPATLATALGVGEVSGGSVYFAGGGGGGKGNLPTGSPGSGGLGGGSGGNGSGGTTPEAIPNTGGGGGGGGQVVGGTWNTGFSGKSGASGVVIVRYTPTKDLVWDKNETAQSFAYTNSQVIPASGSWTYEAWYYLDSNDVSAGYRGLFSQMDTAQAYSQRVSLWLNAGKIHVTTPTKNLDIPNYTFLANRWYHIAYARNVNDVEVFIDGVKLLDQTVANWGTIGPEFAIGGARQWDAAYPEVSGAIDQVKVWSTALDQTGVDRKSVV
jgi:hypothetical protein